MRWKSTALISRLTFPMPVSSILLKIAGLRMIRVGSCPGVIPMSLTSRGIELDVTFQLTPQSLTRVKRPRWLGGVQQGRAQTHPLETTYYDSSALDVRKAGASIRLRQEGRRFVQSLKWRSEGARPDASPRELPQALLTPELNPERLLEAVPALKFKQAILDALEPIFHVSIKRTVRQLSPRPGVEIEMHLDVGTLRRGQTQLPIQELTLELKNGEPAALFEAGQWLLEHVPMRLTPLSKADRGYALLTGEPQPWVKAPLLTLAKGTTAEDAFLARLKGTLWHLRQNEECALNRTHSEGIHQLRVATRRMRSALTIYRKLLPSSLFDAMQGELKWLIGGMGPARDWDVFLEETLPPLEAWFVDESSCSILRKHAERKQDQAYLQAETVLNSPRYARLVLELARWAEGRPWRSLETHGAFYGPAIDHATPLLQKRHRRLLRDGRHFQRMNPYDRHLLRIDIKKIRYVGELFGSLYKEKRVKAYLGVLAELQESLGKLNDVAVAHDLVDGLVTDASPATDTPALQRAAGLTLGWHSLAAKTSIEPLGSTWARFVEMKPMWQS